MMLALFVVVCTVTTVLGSLHVKWSVDGTYLRWSEEQQSTHSHLTS